MNSRYVAVAAIAAAMLVPPARAADTKPAEHDHNHADAPAAAPAEKQTPPSAGGSDQVMKRMHDMHKKMMSAKTPEERQALMDEHMKLMQDGMGMMKGMGKQGGPRGMEKRMDMMEMMMQMMMDREMMESGPMKK